MGEFFDDKLENFIRYMLGHLSMIFVAKWQNFCVRKIPMPMLV